MAELPPYQVAARAFHMARRPRRARPRMAACASGVVLSAALLSAGAARANAQQADPHSTQQGQPDTAQTSPPAPPPPHAKTLPLSKAEAARVHFELAEQERHELEATPASGRTQDAYQKVIDAYRMVYRGDPANPKAPGAMAAVADMMMESGRQFADKKMSRNAVDAYEYLRKQYPTSPIRQRALLAEADIYASDLADPDTARQKYSDFVKQYPNSDLLPQARAGLSGLHQETPPTLADNSSGAAKPMTKPPVQAANKAAPEKPPPATRTAAPSATPTPEPGSAPPAKDTSSAQLLPASTADTSSGNKTDTHHDRLEVTAIRHWITPDSTRVAIDLDGDVRYDVGRATNPDRIYFDLHGAHLSSQLPGHSVSVSGDALLKNIRFAQFTLDTVRVVLDINAAADFSAHLMEDPGRLIIEVHPRAGIPPKTEIAGRPAGTPLEAKSTKPETPEANTARDNPAGAKTAPVTANFSAPDTSVRPAAGSDTAVAATARPPKKGKPHKGTAPSDTPATASAAPATPEEHETGISQPPPDVSVTPEDDGSSGGAAQRIDLRGTHPQATPVMHQPEVNTPAASLQIAAAEIARPDRPEESLPVIAAAAASPALAMPSVPARSFPAKAPETATSISPPAPNPASAGTETIALASGNSLAQPPLPFSSTKARGKDARPGSGPADLQVHEARPTAGGERSLVRALGLKIGRIVIDPGHGGQDNGTVGPDGMAEKDLVLDVSLRLGKLLRDRLGAEVVYTRSDDTFVPLETRTAIANNENADLFISVHANSSPDHSARGVETYYLNFTAAPDSLEVAARENAVSGESVHQLQDLVKEITLKDKIDESREFAADVEHSLWAGMETNNGALKDRGVKKAPFIVLIGANMPSILTEISFVTNPKDARQLRQPAYRERIANSLYAGIARYVNSLSSVRVAQADLHKGN